MTIVKLKMKGIYKSFLAFISILVLLMLAVGILYYYRDLNPIVTSDIVVVGDLSINYVDGDSFEVPDNNKIKLSISNNSDRVNYYTICFQKVRGNGTYKILDNDALISEGNLKTTDELTTDYLSIDAFATKVFIIELANESDNSLKGIISIRNQETKNTNFAELILQNTPPIIEAKTKVGVDVSTEDEGLIKSTDDIGISYYYRGKILNNYVSFGNFLWRIVRINGDGTVRLILDGETATIGTYYTSDNTNYEFENSNMKIILDKWLNENLSSYKDYIANARFCNDMVFDDTNYSANTRIMVNKLPLLACLGTIVRSNIGLLNIDEVILAGANFKDKNQSFYLYNDKITNEWYTMSAASRDLSSLNMFMINKDGSINKKVVGNLYRSIRPVINLEKNIEMIGSGTIDDPYQIKE